MPAYRYSFRGWDFRPISFSLDRMNAIGQAAVESSRARILLGLNVNDAPARPLSKGYAKQKVRAGQPPIRNWRLTGALLASMEVQGKTLNSVSFGFTSINYAKLMKLAAWNSNVEHMTGLSPRDRDNVDRVMQTEFSQEVEEQNR